MSSRKIVVETNTCTSKYEYEWQLRNFFDYSDVLRGPEFLPVRNLPLKFAVELVPNIEIHDDYLGYEMKLINLSKEKISKSCKMEIVVKLINGDINTTVFSTNSNSLTIRDMVDSHHLFPLLHTKNSNNISVINNNVSVNPDLPVTFLFNFTFSGHNITTVSTEDPILPRSSKRSKNILSGLKNLYESKANSDIRFEIGEEILEAHQCILMAQSPVFKRMFENDLTESKTKCIQIIDFDCRVFDCFLKYLYCGDFDDTRIDNVMNLFALADKYDVTTLMKDCRDILASHITVENVCKIAELSYLHSDEVLKMKAIQFINHHFSLIIIKKKAEWNKLIEDHPKLVSEVFSSMTANFE